MRNKDMPAYPVSDDPTHTPGLTKLEAFTMAAVQGIMANRALLDGEQTAVKWVANTAVDVAEAAIAELEKKSG